MRVLTRERERRRWTRAELGRRANLNPSQVGLFETGRMIPYPSQLSKLARALEWPEPDAIQLLEEVPIHDLSSA